MTEHSAAHEPIIDLSALSRHAMGARTPLWWGTVLLIAIESTCFAILFTAYLYVRNDFREWPPDEHLHALSQKGLCLLQLLGGIRTRVGVHQLAVRAQFLERLGEVRLVLLLVAKGGDFRQ